MGKDVCVCAQRTLEGDLPLFVEGDVVLDEEERVLGEGPEALAHVVVVVVQQPSHLAHVERGRERPVGAQGRPHPLGRGTGALQLLLLLLQGCPQVRFRHAQTPHGAAAAASGGRVAFHLLSSVVAFSLSLCWCWW